MKTRFSYSVFVLILAFFVHSCAEKQEWSGDSYINYPDMEMIVEENIKPMQASSKSFRQIVKEGDKQDTIYVKSGEVNWQTVNELFTKSTLFNKDLDKQYTIDVLTDTVHSIMSVVYTSLNAELPVKLLTIKSSIDDRKISSVYVELTEDHLGGFENHKLLFVRNKSLQMQLHSKKPLKDDLYVTTTWTCLN